MDIEQLKNEFRQRYGRDAEGAVRAPGRVNLIGEHTDYNDGFVLPIAVERETVALYARRDDETGNFASMQADEPASFTVTAGPAIRPGKPAWANYCKGVTAMLFAESVPLVGVDVLLDSNVPIGGGLSSSASLEVATAYALMAAGDQLGSVPDMRLAQLCQQAEHKYANSPCGLMDQAIAILGRKGRALLLDCRYRTTRQIHFDNPDVVLLVVDTHVKHGIADGGYAQRRQECVTACEEMHVKSLRDADLQTIATTEGDGRLSYPEVHRARHVVTEIQRTLDGANALETGDYESFGKLMYKSHESLRDRFEVSCAELDAVVESASKCDGVFGARMTGGGFGGCAIVLARAEKADDIEKQIASDFEQKFGHAPSVFATRATDGASVLW
ncbi:MAG: galactokinase [Phycisphaerae bacterium]